jgi:3-hydroxybutyryl-CoA dehydrogenase
MNTLLIIDTTHPNRLSDHPLIQLKPDIINNSELLEQVNFKFSDFDLIIDACFEQETSRVESYAELTGDKMVLVSTPYDTLHNILYEYSMVSMKASLYGFNGLPYFFKNTTWEVSSFNNQNTAKLAQIFNEIGLSTRFVKDQVGLVALRTIATIINEAYFMLAEGSANAIDIDQAMKLGVNYPNGPFEWVAEIGIEPIFNVLHRLKNTVSAETYKIAPALYRAYELSMINQVIAN